MPILTRLGDLIAMKLPDGRVGYAQHVHVHHQYGALIQVKDLITDSEVSVNEVMTAGPLFPPVFVGINVPIRQKLWRIMGNRKVFSFSFPLFRTTTGLKHPDEPGTFDDWLLWDGKEYTKLGRLPPEHRCLEFLVVWASDLLEKRIVTGENHPYQYMY